MFTFRNLSKIFNKNAVFIPNSATGLLRNYSSVSRMKVVVLGAAGRVGMPVSLMLKQSNVIDELAIMDIKGTCGLGLELGHIDTKCRVYAYTGYSNIQECLNGAKIVTIVAAAKKTSTLSHAEMFEPNANLIKELGDLCAEYCPTALFAIATDPVNSMVPVFSEVMKKQGKYNPHSIFGITTLDVIRANTYVADILGLDPECVLVPIIGGSSTKTIVPVLSHTKPYPDFKEDELEQLTKQIQSASSNMRKLKPDESAYLSCSFAISRFIISLVKAIKGQGSMVECAYVRSSEHPHAKYLATPIQLGPRGVQKNLGIPNLTDYETCLLDKAIKQLRLDIKKAEAFMNIDSSGACDPCKDPKKPCPDHCKQAKGSLYS